MKSKFKKIGIVFSLVTCILPYMNNYAYANEKNKFKVNLKSVIAIDADSGKILYNKNSDKKSNIASLSKVMTLLITLESIENGTIKKDDVVELSKTPDSWGSRFYLEKGDKYTIDDLINMIMIISANDACIVLAEHIYGSVDKFVEQMNIRASQIGMSNTKFFNTNGLPLSREAGADPGNISTARDLAFLTKYVVDNYGDYVSNIVSNTELKLKGMEDARYNTNKLLFRNKETDGFEVNGFKTGYTTAAGFCLIATSSHNINNKSLDDDYNIISVTLGGDNSEERFVEHKKILTHIQENYKNTELISSDKIIKTVNIKDSDNISIGIVPQKDLNVLTMKDNTFEKEVTINEDIKLPVKVGDVLGSIKYTNKNTEEVYEVNLVSNTSASKPTLIDKIIKLIFKK